MRNMAKVRQVYEERLNGTRRRSVNAALVGHAGLMFA